MALVVNGIAALPQQRAGVGNAPTLAARAALLPAPAALAVYLVIFQSVPVLVTAKAVGIFLPLTTLVGYAIQRLALRTQVEGAFATVVSSLLLGSLATPLIWYVFCALRIGWLVVPSGVALTMGVAVLILQDRRASSKDAIHLSGSDAVAVWVVLGVMVLWAWGLGVFGMRDGRLHFLPYTDHVLHVLLIGELGRGIPPETVPFISGAERWAYHQMPDVWAELLRRVTGTDVTTAYFGLALSLRYVLVGLAGYLVLARRFGRPAAILGVLSLFCIVGIPGRMLGVTWFQTYFRDSYPTAFGLVGVFLAFYYVSLADTQRYHGGLLLASAVSVGLLWCKANFAVAVAPAVAVVVVVVLIGRRDFRWLAVCLGVMALLSGVRFWELSSADMRGTFVFAPWAFVDFLWQTQGTWWGIGVVSAVINKTIVPTIDSLPAVLAWPAKLAFHLLYRFHLGLIVVPYLVYRFRRDRDQEGVPAFDALFLLVFVVGAIGFVLLPIQKGMTGNVSIHIVFLLHALLLMAIGPALIDLGRAAIHRRSKKAIVASLAAFAVLGMNVHSLFALTAEDAQAGKPVNEGLCAASRWIANHTPKDAVILHPDYHQEHTATALLAERRVVLDFGPCWARQGMCDVKRMMTELDRFYAGTDAASTRAVLDRYDVDYVVVNHAEKGQCPNVTLLTRAFRMDDVAVYRVERPAVKAGAHSSGL